jgi:hypothetical protein
MKALLLASAVTLAVIGNANAYTIRGAGTGSCGSWLESRIGFPSFGARGWVMGYLSARVSDTNDLLEKLDSDAVFYWLDNHCQRNPTMKLADSLDVLLRSMN